MSNFPHAFHGPIPDFNHSTQKNPWIFSEAQTLYYNPSTLKDPVKWVAKAEVWSRHQCCMFIEKVGKAAEIRITSNLTLPGLGLPDELINIAKVLLHRFYMRVPMQSVYRWEVCGALLFLSGKLGELPQFKHVETVAYTCAATLKKGKPSSEERKLWEKRIKQYEVDIMREIFGDLHPVLPHSKAREIIESFKGSEELQRAANKCCNDALITTLAVRAFPHQIAQAAVLLACFKTKQSLTRNGQDWWRVLKLNKKKLDAYAQEISTARHIGKVFEIITLRKDQLQEAGLGPPRAQIENETPRTQTPSSGR